MPFPISFSSFGDIVTAVDLALRISKALSASTGSSYEYQYLIQELDALAHVLQLADTATRTGMLQPDVVRALVSEIGRCRTVMDALWERIRGYQKALGGSSKTSGKISGSSWRKIGWALFKTQDVQETRMKLATHRANLTTLMTACNLSNIDELKTQCVRFEKTMHSRLSELYNIISQLPYRLGHTNDNAITFVDWRGIETILPLHLVNHNRDQLHALLGALSLQWPGHARWWVENIHYWLVRDDTKEVLPRVPGYMEVLGSGTRIRMVYMCVSNQLSPEISKSAGGGVRFDSEFEICTHCYSRLGSTNTNTSFLQAVALESTTDNVLRIFGSSPENATYLVTIQEVDAEDGRPYFMYIFHDPLCADCPTGHLGVPAKCFPLTDVARHCHESEVDQSLSTLMLFQGETFRLDDDLMAEALI